MINVFLLLSELTPSLETATARVLALELPRERFSVAVGVMGPATGPLADEFRAAKISVHPITIRHQLDLNGGRRLRRAMKESKPVVLHTFGLEAARAARFVVESQSESGNVPRLVVSGGANPTGGVGGWFTARLIRRADRAIPMTWAEGERYRRVNVPAERLTRILPGAPRHTLDPKREVVLRQMGLPPDARFIVTEAKPEYGTGPKDAIVAFDMLRYDARDLHLVVFGARAGTAALEQFGRSLAFDDFRIHFPDPNTDRFPADFPHLPVDRATAVQLATAVWITSPDGGVDEAVEAMAAGKPVVAWANPDLAEIMDDTVTGNLVPAGDKAALAAKAKAIIDDSVLAAWMGKAGRTRATDRFPVARMVEQFARVYTELAESG
ncbi:MAG: glycosyltransferase family 4 protein [Gemmataceae bacterium]